MDKLERVRKALAGEEVDYVPSGFWFHFPEKQSFGDEAVKAHLDLYEETDLDMLKIMNEYRYRPGFKIEKAADWRRLKPQRIKDSHFQGYVDVVKKIADRLKGEVPLIATIHGVFASAFHCCMRPDETLDDDNLLMKHLKEDPESVLIGFSAIAETLAALSQACLDAGIDGFYYATLGGEDYRFTEEEFLRFIKPYDLQVLDKISKESEFLLLHICSDKLRLPLYADYPCNAANWAIHNCSYSLEDGRRIFKRTILGGLDDRSGVMVDGPEEKIAQAVKELIGGFGKKGFMLGCDCTLPTDIQKGHIRAAIKAAKEC